MPSARIEPAIPNIKRQQTNALDRTAIGIALQFSKSIDLSSEVFRKTNETWKHASKLIHLIMLSLIKTNYNLFPLTHSVASSAQEPLIRNLSYIP
jgi:hypothetical protein